MSMSVDPKPRGRIRQQASRRGGIGLVAAIAVLLSAAMLAAWWQRQPESAGLAERAGFLQDAELLWSWADEALTEGASAASWSARWDAELTAAEADKLADRLQLAAAPGEGLVRQEPGYRLLLWTESADPASPNSAESAAAPAVLLFEGGSDMDKDALFAVLEEAAAAASDAAAPADASLSFRAESASDAAIEAIARLAEAEEVERYEDGGTTSVAYYTDRLSASAMSGDRAVNLQLAIRLDDVRKLWLVTGGMPLITGEYSSL